MASASHDAPVCTCEPGNGDRPQLDPDCPHHGRRYVQNPKLAANSWLQPYVRPQS
jgi:hypothetical protein